MNRKNRTPDISYFRLSLLAFLRESHPQLVSNEQFIATRTESALDAYEQAAKNGNNPIEAEYSANEVLFLGLHFSKYDKRNLCRVLLLIFRKVQTS